MQETISLDNDHFMELNISVKQPGDWNDMETFPCLADMTSIERVGTMGVAGPCGGALDVMAVEWRDGNELRKKARIQFELTGKGCQTEYTESMHGLLDNLYTAFATDRLAHVSGPVILTGKRLKKWKEDFLKAVEECDKQAQGSAMR